MKTFDDILEAHRAVLQRGSSFDDRLIDQHITIAEVIKLVHHELRGLQKSLRMLSDAQERLAKEIHKIEYRLDMRDVQD